MNNNNNLNKKSSLLFALVLIVGVFVTSKVYFVANIAEAAVTTASPVELIADKTTIASGSYALLTQNSLGANSCTLKGGIYGLNGQGVGAGTWTGWTGYLTTTTTYTLVCSMTNGTTQTKNITITVQVIAAANPIIFGADKSTILSGEYAILNVTAVGASGCTLSGGVYTTGQAVGLNNWTGWTAALTTTTTYTLVCNYPTTPSQTKTLTVTVAPPVTLTPITFSVDKNPVTSGQSGLLSVTATGANSCVLTGGAYGVAGQGVGTNNWQGTTGALTSTTTFVVNCAYPNNLTQSKSLTVNVQAVPTVAQIILSFSKEPVTVGENILITMTATAATSCTLSGGIYGSGQGTGSGTWSGSTGNLSTTTTYTLNCAMNNNTTQSLTKTLVVNPLVPPPAPVDTNSTTTISTSHRYETGKVYGGWGAHLGHLLRDSFGVLWFADDSGNNVNSNAGLQYFKRSATSSKWYYTARNDFVGNIQQNTGSMISSSNIIYSYGIDTLNYRIQECTLVTSTLAKSCANLPFVLNQQANYIGAAQSPNGTKVVWWNTVAYGTIGSFHYIYNSGSGWSNVITNELPSFNSMEYARATFVDDTHVNLIAQSVASTSAMYIFTPAIAEITLGEPTTWNFPFVSPVGDRAFTVNDIYFDPISKMQHVMLRTVSGKIAYYSKPLNGKWSSIPQLIPDGYDSRFSAPADGKLYITYGGSGGVLRSRSILRSSIPTTGVNWLAITEKISTLPGTVTFMNSVYPESSIYQTSTVVEPNFGVNTQPTEANVYYINVK